MEEVGVWEHFAVLLAVEEVEFWECAVVLLAVDETASVAFAASSQIACVPKAEWKALLKRE